MKNNNQSFLEDFIETLQKYSLIDSYELSEQDPAYIKIVLKRPTEKVNINLEISHD